METFKTVNQVPTKVITFGTGIEEDLSNVRFLILLFPGNPGVINYYTKFMKAIYAGVKEKYPQEDIPIWGISHAGHQVDNLERSLFPNLDDNSNLYNLEGQFKHKVSFIKTYIPKHIKIIGIGHSVGSKIWMETIKRTESPSGASNYAEIIKCFMLFPTIERMRSTPNGKNLTKLLRFQNTIEKCLWPFTTLPTFVHKMLLRIYFIGRSIPEFIQNASLQLFDFQVLRRTLTMGSCEMDQIFELDIETLNQHLPKLFFYFGSTDSWCPLDYAEGMKQKFPNMSFKICDKGLEHAFVINSSLEMAEIICSLLEITNLN